MPFLFLVVISFSISSVVPGRVFISLDEEREESTSCYLWKDGVEILLDSNSDLLGIK